MLDLEGDEDFNLRALIQGRLLLDLELIRRTWSSKDDELLGGYDEHLEERLGTFVDLELLVVLAQGLCSLILNQNTRFLQV